MRIDQANDGVFGAMDDRQAHTAGLAKQQDPIATVAAIVGVALAIGVLCALLARFHVWL